jgi:hypothetical protein
VVVDGSDADSMIRFWLKMGDDETKRCWKMKWTQRARLDSMGRKRDTTRWYGDVDQRRCGTREGKERRRH